MRNKLLLGLVVVQSLFSQNHWDSVISVKPEGLTAVFGNDVNIRSRPNLKASIIYSARAGEQLTILQKTDELFTLQNNKEYWYEVITPKGKGFVWGGLLSDAGFKLGENTLLVRNLGVQNKKMELHLVDETGKTLDRKEIETGPISRQPQEGFVFSTREGKLFHPAIPHLFSIQYFIFSEIEYGQFHERFFSIDSKGKLKEHFVWYPSFCDPPACMEAELLLPGESSRKFPELKEHKISADRNTIRSVVRFFNSDTDQTENYSIFDYTWDGNGFVVSEPTNPMATHP